MSKYLILRNLKVDYEALEKLAQDYGFEDKEDAKDAMDNWSEGQWLEFGMKHGDNLEERLDDEFGDWSSEEWDELKGEMGDDDGDQAKDYGWMYEKWGDGSEDEEWIGEEYKGEYDKDWGYYERDEKKDMIIQKYEFATY